MNSCTYTAIITLHTHTHKSCRLIGAHHRHYPLLSAAHNIISSTSIFLFYIITISNSLLLPRLLLFPPFFFCFIMVAICPRTQPSNTIMTDLQALVKKISLAIGRLSMHSLNFFWSSLYFANCITQKYLFCVDADRSQKRSYAVDTPKDVCVTQRTLQDGWAEYFDENEKKYYYHRASDDTTQWEYPKDACDDEYGSYVRIARLIVKINGLHICVREYPKVPVLSYQYSELLIEPSASWCWDPPERPGFCYIYFVKYFELEKRFMTFCCAVQQVPCGHACYRCSESPGLKKICNTR